MLNVLIVFLPLASAVASGLFGFHIGRKGSMIITTSFMFVSCILSYVAFYNVGLKGEVYHLTLLKWIDCGLLQADWALYFDSLTVVMLIVVTTVSALVHLYSCSYMQEDPHLSRFMSYLSLFTFFMLMLVCADNFVQLFFGWEGVGLCSYLLISFWYTRIQANKAAIKAMLVNRIGDFGLLVAMMLIYLVFRSLDYFTVFALTPYFYNTKFMFLNFETDILTTICFFLFIGAVGKSAQIGLHTWLPDAMEGPTPVSALIHAATMVTAGVFLIIRCSLMFEYAPDILILITIFGALTSFFAATTGLVQNDLKKVIAYSTCSQLGYMMFACGLSHYTVSLFHLANHAFFKALLFLSAGAVIHALSDEQDMRKMGGLIHLLPFTYTMMLIGSMALMGFPFLTGFYSKDVILEIAYTKYSIHSCFAYWLGTISAFFTAYYSWRLLYLTFLSRPNGYRSVLFNAHEPDLRMSIPLGILAFGSIFFGYLTRDLFIGLGTDFFGNAVFTHPRNLVMIDAEFIPHTIKLIPVIFSLSGGFLAFILNHYFVEFLVAFKFNYYGQKIYNFLSKKWYFDKVYNVYVAKKILDWGYDYTFKSLDKGFIEFFGPEGLSKSFYDFSKKLSRLHTGLIYDYSFVMAISFFIITFIVLSLTYFI